MCGCADAAHSRACDECKAASATPAPELLHSTLVAEIRRGPFKAALRVGIRGTIILSTSAGWMRLKQAPRSRADILRACRELIGRTARRGARWPDGTLHGFKGFAVSLGLGILRSPLRDVEWPSVALTAHAWNSGEMLRGVAGIHACWPQRCMTRPFGDEIAADWVLAEVAGHGTCVTGDIGWRSQHAIIKRIHIPPTMARRQAAAIAARYQPQGVQICTSETT